MTIREQIDKALDELGPEALNAILRYAEELKGKEVHQPAKEISHEEFERILKAAPIDDEPLTEDDIEAIERGRKAIKEGRIYSYEEGMKRLGLEP